MTFTTALVHRSVVGHVGQVALLFRDGVFVLAGLGVVDGREGDGAVLAVLGAPDGLLALQLLSRQVASYRSKVNSPPLSVAGVLSGFT